jgi:hypothetical protein
MRVSALAEGWEDIEEFGIAKLDWLMKYYPLIMVFPNMIPLRGF